MSCNAVAVVSARVDVESFDSASRVLGKVALLKIVQAYSQKKDKLGSPRFVTNGYGESIFIIQLKDNVYPVEIVVRSSGIEVRGGWKSDQDEISAEIGKLLARATSLVLGNKIEAALGRKARITEDKSTASGARVIGFEF